MSRRWLVINKIYINLDQVVEIDVDQDGSNVKISYAVMTLNTDVYTDKASYSGLHSRTFTGDEAKELIIWLRFLPADVIFVR